MEKEQPLSQEGILEKCIEWKMLKSHQVTLFMGENEVILPHEKPKLEQHLNKMVTIVSVKNERMPD